jgi:FMN-dependent NADH-azoreductase
MTHILHVVTSPNVTGSQSRKAAGHVLADIGGTIKIRDLSETPLPQVTADWNAARLILADERTADQADVLALSDVLVTEIQDADTILIGMPMYNFGMPAALKAWVDLICRPKVTFEYTSDGPRGLLVGKKAIIVVASGGVVIDSAADFATPHLRHVLEFVGITDITTVVAKEINATRA